MNDLDLCLEVV